MQQAIVNKAGIETIRAFCAEALGIDVSDVTERCINQCAAEAEESWDLGNGMQFEVGALLTHNKRPHVCLLKPSDFDILEVDE